jgi:2-aminoethylphosphonate-pyruvate transaminase
MASRSEPDKPLYTPGPLTTSRTVKEAMLRDVGSRDLAFIETVRNVRTRLLQIGGTTTARGYETILLQGSGTFGIEAVIATAVPPSARLLIVANGAYGERMVAIARVHGISHDVLRVGEASIPDPAAIDAALERDPGLSHVAAVHCETTTGIVNPIQAIGDVVRRRGRVFLVDSMSGFGALPLDIEAAGISFLVSSANKCIEGVPGFCLVICRREALLAAEGTARSLSLDLLAQWRGLELNGQFRFTPPTHAILAFQQALDELDEEGGPPGRLQRYRENQTTLLTGMQALGFRPYLDSALQSPIITSFHDPQHPAFLFDPFYRRLNDRGFVIYPGKVTEGSCFRIGTIGRLFPEDMTRLVAAIEAVLHDMGIPVPVA